MAEASGERKRVLLILLDISSYTRFAVVHGKAQAHCQMIIAALLEALMAEAEGSFEVAEVEGDAIFLYADRGPAAEGSRPAAWGLRLLDFFRTFSAAVHDLRATAICKCPACAELSSLRLKAVVHCGEAVLSRLASFTKLAGLDVIVAHRLLKNSLDADEYVLLTDAAAEHVALPAEIALEAWREEYPEIGPVDLQVARDLSRISRWEDYELTSPATSEVAYEILRHEIRMEYGAVATEPERGFHFHTGRTLAKLLGYAAEDIDAVPDCSLRSFAGTGNPHSLAALQPGEHVVDVGCGAGFDTLVAARRVGETGRVIGVDMTEEMLSRAREGVQQAGVSNVELREGYAESLPVEDGWADVVISNGVLNLCPNKPAALAEMHRVLKPGGRLQIGDILIQRPLPESARRDIDLWTG